MSLLREMKCEPCRGDDPTVTEEEMTDLKPKVPNLDYHRSERRGRYPDH